MAVVLASLETLAVDLVSMLSMVELAMVTTEKKPAQMSLRYSLSAVTVNMPYSGQL